MLFGGEILNIRTLSRGLAAAALAIVIAFTASSAATDILQEWDAVKPPPRPELKPVTLQTSTTALLILDLMKTGACPMRPRCLASIPAVRRMHDSARSAGAMVWYSLVGAEGKAIPSEFIDQSFAPREGEYARTGGPDKFLDSGLDEKLKAHGIKTVIVCGTSFQGSGIGAASGAAQRGYNVVVPVDCLSSEDLFDEQYAAWHLFKGGPGVVTSKTTLTRTAMVKFSK